jgi:protein TonB
MVVSGTQGEDGARRGSVAGRLEHSAEGDDLGNLATPGAVVNDGRPFGFALGEVSGKPKVLKSVPVVYPVEARKRGITGQVLVRFHLDENGTVSHLHVKSAEPPDIFNQNALNALRQWRFQPARHNKRAVSVWVELPIEFDLRL